MKNKIKRFFLGYENPANLYEQWPLFAWVVFIALGVYAIWGISIVFFS